MSKRVFILGSGFSKHLSGGDLGITQDLTNNIHQHIPELKPYIQTSTKSENDPIQNILSRLELTCEDPREKQNIKKQVVDYFQEKLSVQKLFENTNQLTKAKKLVSDLFTSEDTIISMNWDVITESLIDLNIKDKDSMYFKYEGVDSIACPQTNVVSIIKPHGSFNFFPYIPKNEKNNDEQENSQDTLLHLEKDEKKFKAITESHPNLNYIVATAQHVNFKDGDYAKLKSICNYPFETCNINQIISPNHINPYPSASFFELWHHVKRVIEKSTEIIIIGYSFPIEDILMTHMFHQNLCPENPSVLNESVDILYLDSKEAIDKFVEKSPNSYSLDKKIKRFSPSDCSSQESWDSAYKKLLFI